MLISLLILWPLLGIFIIYSINSSYETNDLLNTFFIKKIALFFSLIEILISLTIWFLFDNTSKHFQFVQEQYTIGHYDIYLGLDGLSIYFVLLTTFIISISIISNWKSINENSVYFLVIMLLLESALLLVYSVLDILMFYVFFESILAPLFVLIGLFGSKDKLRAGFYLFLYTLLGSLFMLLSIITIYSLTGSTDMDIINYTNYTYITQVFLFIGIFVAFAVKTPVIFLNSWLLKAHVESPLSGSVILAAIVLKLSLYGVFRLILPLVPKAFMYYTYIVFVICVITILYASFSTIRTIDVKELIAYSSVSHAVVYLGAVFSNVIQGIQGGILLGLAHGFVSSGLFICAGGVLYDRSHTRTIYYYGGLAQIMPIYSILFFILCLGNCGTPLTLNFVGEFMSLYGIFERIPLVGMFASTSIVLSAAYTIFMFNRISYGGVFKYWNAYLLDLNFRECYILTILVVFTVLAGIYPSVFLDSLHYVSTNLLFSGITYNEGSEIWNLFYQDNTIPQMERLDSIIILCLTVLSPFVLIISAVLSQIKDILNMYIWMNYDTIVKWYNPVIFTGLIIFRLLFFMDYEYLDPSLCPFSDTPIEETKPTILNVLSDKERQQIERKKEILFEQEWLKQQRKQEPTEVIEVRTANCAWTNRFCLYIKGDTTGRLIEDLTGTVPCSPSPNPSYGPGVAIGDGSKTEIFDDIAKGIWSVKAPTSWNPQWFDKDRFPFREVTSGYKPLTKEITPTYNYMWNVYKLRVEYDYNHKQYIKMYPNYAHKP